MPAARTFSPPITANAATSSDALRMIAFTRLDMMMRISIVRRWRSAFGVPALYLHFWMRPAGHWLQISGSGHWLWLLALTTDGYFFLRSVTGLYRVRLR